MEWCITLFFNAAISVFNYLILFFFGSENNKVWVFTVVTYKDQKSIIAHKCYVLLKYLQFKSIFLGKMYANSYRKKIWRIQYVDNAENRTMWADTILIMRWETSDWNMNDFRFRFLLQHLLNINQNFKVLPEEIEIVIFCVLRCVFFPSYAFNETKINNIYIIAKTILFHISWECNFKLCTF